MRQNWNVARPRHPRRLPVGLNVLFGFFAFGASMSFVALVGLAFPDTQLSAIWQLNPNARTRLGAMGAWALVLMAVVCTACAAAASGLRQGLDWARRLAVVILSVNVVGDALNFLVFGDARTLIGLPIGGAMIGYLSSKRVREFTMPADCR